MPHRNSPINMSQKTPKVILITGASSGIGRDAALLLARQGHRVYAAARRAQLLEDLRSEGIVPLPMDVTDHASMAAGVDQLLKAEGRIDVLVNNAGYGYFGPIEEVHLEEARRQLEVNVFGLADLCRLVLPTMRKQHSGRIVNTSSIAGRLVLPFGGWYHVSKYSVEALSDALRMELQPFGIKVSMIEPGGIRTDWGIIAAKHLFESADGGPYGEEALAEARLIDRVYRGRWLTDPARVAHAICRAVNSRCPRARYRLGRFSHSAVVLHALLPARCWDALLRRFMSIRID